MQPFPKLLFYKASPQTAVPWNTLGPTTDTGMRHNKDATRYLKGTDWVLEGDVMEGTMPEVILKEKRRGKDR